MSYNTIFWNWCTPRGTYFSPDELVEMCRWDPMRFIYAVVRR